MLILASLVEPLGLHRRTHLPPSRGRKRKRKAPADIDADTAPPAAPPLNKYLLIGLNSITRHLSARAAAASPEKDSKLSLAEDPSDKAQANETPSQDLPKITLLAVPTLNPSTSLAHTHLPTLLYLSSVSSTPQVPSLPRLVTLPPASETRLSSALCIPRVGAIALLEEAPGAEPLVQYVRERVGVVECKWIEEGLKPLWSGVKGRW